jgi:acylphosphatase
MSDRCVRLSIRGQVQGVGYRFTMASRARELGLTGWVRNRRDDSVEAIVAGPAHAVDALVAWSHRGPPAAQVVAVTVEPADGTFAGFDIVPTA